MVLWIKCICFHIVGNTLSCRHMSTTGVKRNVKTGAISSGFIVCRVVLVLNGRVFEQWAAMDLRFHRRKPGFEDECCIMTTSVMYLIYEVSNKDSPNVACKLCCSAR